MKSFCTYIFTSILLLITVGASSQVLIRGKIYDRTSKEPVTNASVQLINSGKGTSTDPLGRFSVDAAVDDTLLITSVNYETQKVKVGKTLLLISLTAVSNKLQEVIVSASRTAEKRSEAPVAIAVISKQTIEDTKAQRLDQLLNKVSGVFMVSLGNEQHEMSIRQPMTTKSLFLYMEDGIPIRTTGVYNHNALLEMNLPAAKSIEVIKGPSSALYGAEAIAGAVNVITQASPAYTNGYVSIQGNDNGYKRVDAQAGTAIGKWGIIASGYYANRNNGKIDFSDFHKTAFSLRTDYKPTEKTTWTNTMTYVDYYSDMTGALDSVKFAKKDYNTPHTFTFRGVNALRVKSMLRQQWTANAESNIAFMFRDNSVKQNPSYSVGTTANPLVYRGQINENAFKTYALFAQHTQSFNWMKSKVVAGASVDKSPQTYHARFISIQKDAVSGKYISYTSPTPDSLLQNYRTDITNVAGYVNYELSPFKDFRIVAAMRYDAFRYDFTNKLDTSKTTVAASSINNYSRFTPKIGFTYNYKGVGFYANYSQGYVPPQLTELYTSGSKVAPYLLPQTFTSYEAGGWLSLFKNRLYADWSIYLMRGSNEIISVKQPDNTYINQNTGKTKHIGIEYGVTYKPTSSWSLRISATNAKHTFSENIVRGINYSGKEMSSAPRFTGNAEITWKPAFIKGFRWSAEWQHQGAYFMDDLDKFKYEGFDVFNTRAGYTIKAFEVWVNVLNAFDKYYSILATKNATTSGNASYSYQLGDPREVTLGFCYRFGK